jgi:multidrug resistance efflux pump
VAGATAQRLYEQSLSLGYAPILKATLQTAHLEDRTIYIHEARIAARTMKDRESDAKLEQMQGDLDGSSVTSACSDWKFAADQREPIWQVARDNIGTSRSNDDLEEQIADLEGKQYRASGTTASDLREYAACLATKEASAQKDGDRLNHDLCTTAGISSL